MDSNINQNYIEMCKKLSELQEEKCKQSTEDFKHYKYNDIDLLLYHGELKYCEYVDWNFTIYTGKYATERAVFWIPTFSQWLEIYKKYNEPVHESIIITWFADFVIDKVKEDHEFCLKYQSKEELIMLFVVEKIYKRYWDGKEWSTEAN